MKMVQMSLRCKISHKFFFFTIFLLALKNENDFSLEIKLYNKFTHTHTQGISDPGKSWAHASLKDVGITPE